MSIELFDRARDKYGLTMQMTVALEEMAELQKEITKLMRGQGSKEHLIEEIADVRIMLLQITYFLNISNDDIIDMIQFKLNRLAKRINAKEG